MHQQMQLWLPYRVVGDYLTESLSSTEAAYCDQQKQYIVCANRAKVMAAVMADSDLTDALVQRAMEDICKALQNLKTNQAPGTTVPDVAKLAQGNAARHELFDVASEQIPKSEHNQA